MRYLVLIVLVNLLLGCADQMPDMDTDPPATYRVLAFTAPYCASCQREKPEIAKLESVVRVTLIDSSVETTLSQEYGVRFLPTYILLKDGVEQSRTHRIEDLFTQLRSL